MVWSLYATSWFPKSDTRILTVSNPFCNSCSSKKKGAQDVEVHRLWYVCWPWKEENLRRLFHAQTNTFARMAPRKYVLRYYFTILNRYVSSLVKWFRWVVRYKVASKYSFLMILKMYLVTTNKLYIFSYNEITIIISLIYRIPFGRLQQINQ